MTRRTDQTGSRDDGMTPGVPTDLRAVDALLSEALAEWARSDAARADRIHRATVAAIGVPSRPRRIAPPRVASGWRLAFYIGGGLAAAATVMLVLRSGSDEADTAPAKAPLEMVEAPAPTAGANPAANDSSEVASAAEPVLVALIERDASRWSEDWTAGTTYDHSAAWAGVVPVLETRDAGFDVMAGEVGAILTTSLANPTQGR